MSGAVDHSEWRRIAAEAAAAAYLADDYCGSITSVRESIACVAPCDGAVPSVDLIKTRVVELQNGGEA